MQAPDRPRRPIRRMQRTRGSCRARERTTSQVPSGELSSTNTTSQAMPAKVASSRRYSTVTLSRSLKVGTTTESCGKPLACDGFSEPGLMASFMRQAYIRSLRRCQGAVPDGVFEGGKPAKKAPEMPTTTNRRRAYIRRYLTIPWSSRRRSYEASTSPLKAKWGCRRQSARGPVAGAFRKSIGHFPNHRPPGGRRGLSRRLLDTGRLGRRLAELPDRPIGDRNHQHDGGNNSAQNARN